MTISGNFVTYDIVPDMDYDILGMYPDVVVMDSDYDIVAPTILGIHIRVGAYDIVVTTTL